MYVPCRICFTWRWVLRERWSGRQLFSISGRSVAPAIDLIAPDIYMPEYDKYTKVLDLYQRPDNALFVSETGNPEAYALFFAVLGHQGIGCPSAWISPGTRIILSVPKVNPETIAAFGANYELVRPMMRELADLSLHGRLHGVAEDPAVHVQIAALGIGGRHRMAASIWTCQLTAGESAANGRCFDCGVGTERIFVTGYHKRAGVSTLPSGRGVGRCSSHGWRRGRIRMMKSGMQDLNGI